MEFMNIWLSIGQQLFNLHPENPAVKMAEKYLDKLEDFIETQVQVQTFLNIIQTVFILEFLGAGLQNIPGLEPTGKYISKSVDDFTNIHKLLETGGQVITDTIADELETIRRDVIRSIDDLDDRTVFNLDAVADHVNQSSRTAIDGINQLVDSTYKFLGDVLTEHVLNIEQNLQDPESKARLAQEEINLSNGLGFAVGLKRLLFRERKTGGE